MQDYWHRQTPDKPLFPDLLWSRPENKRQAGKLLVTGGNVHSFAAPAEAYGEAAKAGVGTARVLLPDSLQKTVGKLFPEAEYAPSTPVGSFSRQALAELLDRAGWADAVLLAGDFGRNSETAVLLEQFINNYSGPLLITQDGADYFVKIPAAVLERTSTCLVISFAQLQKLAMNAGSTTAFRFDMDFLHLVEALHDLTDKYPAAIVVKHLENIFVAARGRVSSTKLASELLVWRVKIAARGAVWWLQNADKTFESLTASLVADGGSH